MYYAQRCCATLDCATEIYRSTSTDGSAWTTKEDAVLAFATAPFLTLPSVVYDPAKTRWVMTLSEAQASEKYQPTFYHSADGIDNWTAGVCSFRPQSIRVTVGRHISSVSRTTS
eukprot:Polyplicarium_translucidae@DN2374_c0_g1_i3.p1